MPAFRTRLHRPARPVLLALSLAIPSAAVAESTCFGTTSNGRLEAACNLPSSGENFTAYSSLLRLAGRTHVHCEVRRVVLDAYRALHESRPGTVFVYGETGKRKGGPFPPHKTHQNGLSVDFMAPVLDREGRSVPLPTHVLNRYGYDVEFTLDGRHRDLTLDFEAVAAHLAALKSAADAAGVGIRRVLFDPEMQPALRATDAWPEIASLTFATRRSWVRHDDHYHVDFDMPCEPM